MRERADILRDKSKYAVFYNFRMSALTPSSFSWPEYLKNAYELLDTEDGLIKVAPSTRCESYFERPGSMVCEN